MITNDRHRVDDIGGNARIGPADRIGGHKRPGRMIVARHTAGHDEADRAAGRRIACPMLLLASTMDDIDIHGDPAEIWQPWVAGELRSVPIHSGHHQAEQAPDELAQVLLEFLNS